MAREPAPIDISDLPELVRIVEEVRISQKPRRLRHNQEDVAILVPVNPASRRRLGRPRTEADVEAFLASAGSWKGIVDTDKLIADIYESRRRSSRPPVEL